jgi:hypothetical protein
MSLQEEEVVELTKGRWGKGKAPREAITGLIQLNYSGEVIMSRQYSGQVQRREYWAMMNRYAKHRKGAFITIIPE